MFLPRVFIWVPTGLKESGAYALSHKNNTKIVSENQNRPSQNPVMDGFPLIANIDMKS